MTRRMRLAQIISHLRLKDNTNLEWVLDTLEALDDTTAFKARFREIAKFRKVVRI